MSMNIHFETKNGHHVECNFQTPTDLSYKLLRESDRQKRVDIFLQYLKDRGICKDWDDWNHWIIQDTVTKLLDTDLILEVY